MWENDKFEYSRMMLGNNKMEKISSDKFCPLQGLHQTNERFFLLELYMSSMW